MRITDKVKKFLLPCNGERIKLLGIVNGKYSSRVKHNSHGDKHWEYSISIRDVKANINGNIGYIKKLITMNYNRDTSKFHLAESEDIIEFNVRIQIIDNNLYLERPTKINIISSQVGC